MAYSRLSRVLARGAAFAARNVAKATKSTTTTSKFEKFTRPQFYDDLKRSVPSLKTTLGVTTAVTAAMELLLNRDVVHAASDVTSNTTSKLQKIEKSQIIIPSQKKLELSGLSKERCEAVGRVAIQAAKDLGHTNPVVVFFNDTKTDELAEKLAKEKTNSNDQNTDPAKKQEESRDWFTPLPTGMNAVCATVFNGFPKRSPVFVISHDTAKKSTPEELYAVAGHEALHGLEDHSALFYSTAYANYAFCKYLLKNATPRLFSKLPILSSLFLTLNMRNLISQLVTEYRADTISAKKLGTAKHLQSFLTKSEKDAEEQFEAYIKNGTPADWLRLLAVAGLASTQLSSHPSKETRLRYLEELQKQPGYLAKLNHFRIAKDPQIQVTQENDEDKKQFKLFI